MSGPEQLRPHRPRVSHVMEAVGYIGTILVLTGVSVAVGQRWDDIAHAGRLAILGALTLAFLAVGLLVRSSAEPAFRRLSSVTLAVSVAAFAGSAAVVNQFVDTGPEIAFVTIATPSTVYALLLWLLNRAAIQHVVMFAGVLLSAASLVNWPLTRSTTWISTAVWAIGMAWVAAGWSRRLRPWRIAVPVGLLAALIGPAAMQANPARFGVGLATAAAVMALGVVVRFLPGLAMGSVAMLAYVVGLVLTYFADSLGVAAALAIAGGAILVVAAVASRLFGVVRRHPAEEMPRVVPTTPVQVIVTFGNDTQAHEFLADPAVVQALERAGVDQASVTIATDSPSTSIASAR